jgi:putative membrane protein
MDSRAPLLCTSTFSGSDAPPSPAEKTRHDGGATSLPSRGAERAFLTTCQPVWGRGRRPHLAALGPRRFHGNSTPALVWNFHNICGGLPPLASERRSWRSEEGNDLKRLVLGIACAGLIGGCATRPVAPPAAGAPAISPAAAAAAMAYVQTALGADQFAMQSSQLALQTSPSPAVRAFAQNLTNGHAQLSAELNGAATATGVAAPQIVMLPHHSAQLGQLQYMRGAEFDAAYRNMQITALAQALDAHQRYAATGELSALRNFAANAVPLIQSELNHAQAFSVAPPSHRPPNYRRSGERG